SFADGQRDCWRVDTAARELRQEHDEQHSCQVLDDEHAEQDVAVRRGELLALLERLEDDHRARDSDDAAEEQTLAKRPAEEGAETEAGGDGEEDLQGRAADGNGADFAELADGKLDAEGEHEEDD